MSNKIVLQGEVTLIQRLDGEVELSLITDGEVGTFMPILPVMQENKTATPTEQAQVVTPDPQYNGLRRVSISAIPSDYVGSAVIHDPTITVTGRSVNVPKGYYTEDTTASVQGAEQATPSISISGGDITATSVQSEGYVQTGTRQATASIPTVEQATPSLSVSSGGLITAVSTQAGGYVTAGTKTATSQLSTMAGQTVTPSTSSQSLATQGKFMTGNVIVNAIPTGTAGTPTATKGTVSNHSVTITPSVTNATGYITGGTITGTSVSVSASELVSGTLSVTQNGIADVTNYAGIDVNVAGGGGAVKMGVIRPDAELIQKWTYDKWLVADEGISLPSTYSTTSQTLKATANIATYDGTPSTYRYFIAQRCLTIPTYNIATLAKGREEYVYSVGGWEWAYQPQGELCSLNGTKTYGQYSQMAATGAFTREVLWNSATALNVYTSTAYCLAQNLQAPAIANNKTITIKSPTVTIRGHTTYLTQTFYEAITDARLQYVIELWRVPIDDVIGWITGSQMRSLYDDIANNGGTLR